MKLAVLIQVGAYQYEAPDTAFNLIKTAVSMGHKIIGVFFYCDGVTNATGLSDIQQDDRNVQRRWGLLGEEYDIDMVVCVAAAKLRGITEDILAPGFKISGLGQLTEMTIEADRVITFGS